MSSVLPKSRTEFPRAAVVSVPETKPSRRDRFVPPETEADDDLYWGLSLGDRRFLGVSLVIMALLLGAHAWRQASRAAFQVHVIRAIDAETETQPTSASLLPVAAAAASPSKESPVGSTSFQLDINSADEAAWRLLDGIGETLARRIVEDRASRGPFTSIDDVLRVKGIGPKTLARMRPHLKLNSDTNGD